MTNTENPNQFTFSNVIDLIRNVNFSGITKSVSDCFDNAKNIYQQNKKNADFVLCLICFFFIMLGLLDISVISSLYFLGLTYMTVRTVGNFYNKLPISDKDLTLLQRIEAMDLTQMRGYLIEYSSLGNNWLMYSSLIMCDWTIKLVSSLIGNGLIFGSVLQIIRFLLYMQYCKRFIKSLEPYCEEEYQSEHAYISDELAKKLLLSTYVKHLINLIAINNIFCYNLFAKTNLKVLILIDGCSSSGVDMLSTVFLSL